jgi:hypothetical protein
MTDRPIVYTGEQARDYDFLSLARDTLIGLGLMTNDFLGTGATVVFGLAATPDAPADLKVNIAAGRIYKVTQVDATQYGVLGQDTDLIDQQGIAAAQQLTLTTAGAFVWPVAMGSDPGHIHAIRQRAQRRSRRRHPQFLER